MLMNESEWHRAITCQALATQTIIIMSVIKLSLFWSPNREIINYSEIKKQ